MKKFKFISLLTAVAIFSPIMDNAHAYPIKLDFNKGKLSSTNGKAGNSYTFNVGNFNVLATAFSDQTPDGNGKFAAAFLGKYGSTFGVNSAKDESHTVDNKKAKDLVLFEFSAPVTLGSIRLNAFGDTDITAWMGTANAGLSIAGSSFDLLSSLGFTNLGNNLGGNSNRTAVYNSTVGGNYLLISALRNQSDDSFKIGEILLNTFTRAIPPTPPGNTAVPEPATMALLTAGLLGARFRRKS